ncbi:MAG: ATP-binding protein [Bdellovibrionia bacterium]
MNNSIFGWKNLRIKPMVLVGIFIGLVIPTVVVFTFSSAITWESLRDESIQEHNRIIKTLSISSSFPLWNFDKASLLKISEAVMTDDRVVSVSVADSQGKSFLSTALESRRIGESLIRELPIQHDGINIGKVQVEFSLAKLRSKMFYSSLIDLFQFGIQVVICFTILALLINTRIISRLKRVNLQAQQLADRFLNQSFIWEKCDEISELGQALETTRISLKDLFDQLERKNRELDKSNRNLENYKNNLERTVDERTKQLRAVQQSALENAHMAGMAEIATGVLHNIGNTINTVNIANEVLIESINASEISTIIQASNIMSGHRDNLLEFITHDPKGILLLNLFMEAGKVFEQEQKSLLREALALQQGLTVVKEAIAMQQDYAGTGLHQEEIQIPSFLEDVLRLEAASFDHHKVEVRKDLSDTGPVVIQKNKLLNVVINLFRNAREAMEDLPESDRVLTIRTFEEGEYIAIEVKDMGVGMDSKILKMLFTQGFTSKKNGHGFGLHSAANAMAELGGSIKADSPGPGKGAQFTILLPKIGKVESID